jgi:hypothetical protein
MCVLGIELPTTNTPQRNVTAHRVIPRDLILDPTAEEGKEDAWYPGKNLKNFVATVSVCSKIHYTIEQMARQGERNKT